MMVAKVTREPKQEVNIRYEREKDEDVERPVVGTVCRPQKQTLEVTS